MLCIHPDGYNPGYGYLVPWPAAELKQADHFRVHIVGDDDEEPEAVYVKSLLQSDGLGTKSTEEEEEWPGYTGGLFLGRRVVAAGGIILGDLMEEENRGNPSVPAIQGIIHYGY